MADAGSLPRNPNGPSRPNVAVYALDVGQGDCTFVVSGDPHDGVVMFDCNDPYVAERFVVDHTIITLHALVVSHLDRDHIRGVLPFMKWFLSDQQRTIQHVYIGLDRNRESIGRTAAELIDALLAWRAPLGLTLHSPQREDSPKQVWNAAGWCAELVLPRYEDLLEDEMTGEDEPNRCSVVLRITCAGRAVLLGGDAPLVSWENLEAGLLSACAVRAPHHGGEIRDGSPSWDERTFYDSTDAEAVILSVGTNNAHGHPVEGHLTGIAAPDQRRLLCTQLTPRCHDDVAGIRTEMLRTASTVTYAPYRHRYSGGTRVARPQNEVPCAGSIVVELFDDGHVHTEPPLGHWHDRLIDRMHLTSPRCRARGAG